MKRVLCIARRDGNLVASLVSDDWSVSELALEAVSRSVFEQRDEVLAAWAGLAAASVSVRSLADLALIAARTIPASEKLARLPELRPDAPRPRATAAHPRAFRGTKYKPPKGEGGTVRDLRRELSGVISAADPGFEAFRPCLEGLEPELRRRGLESEEAARLVSALRTREKLDLGLAARHPHSLRTRALPQSLHRLSCLARGASAEQLASLRDRLFLDDEQVIAGAARLLTRLGPDALQWLSHAAAQPRELQGAFLKEVDACGIRAEHASRFNRDQPLIQAGTARWTYLKALAADAPAGLLFAIAAVVERLGARDAHLSAPRRHRADAPLDALERLFGKVAGDDPRVIAWLLPGAAALCVERPEVAKAIAEGSWERMSGAAITRLLEGLLVAADGERSTWSSAWRVVPGIVDAALAAGPAYDGKVLSVVMSVLGNETPPWSDPPELQDATLAFARRIAAPPFEPVDRMSYALEPVLRSPPTREVLLACDDAALVAFEKVCRKGDVAALAHFGMKELVADLPSLVADAFKDCPALLAKSARELGVLPAPVARTVVEAIAEHPFVRRDPFENGLASALREEARLAADAPLPFPRAIRDALVRGESVAAGRLERALRVAREGLAGYRLELLRRRVEVALARGWTDDLQDKRVRHALEMAALVQRNRHALRTVLARYFSGDRDFVWRHPESKRWFQKHPKLDGERWKAGLVRRVQVPGFGTVTFSFEQDLLEALRLGTVVGSCLGLNGVCDYSAAAAVMDVNKRVLYARDERGQILGRQLLAIGDSGALVAFAVYPAGVPGPLATAFLDYDLALAEWLGLRLAEAAEDAEVANVLSEAFWDDGLWDVVERPPA